MVSPDAPPAEGGEEKAVPVPVIAILDDAPAEGGAASRGATALDVVGVAELGGAPAVAADGSAVGAPGAPDVDMPQAPAEGGAQVFIGGKPANEAKDEFARFWENNRGKKQRPTTTSLRPRSPARMAALS
eukprot:944724-Alexandrium_andersonii.AAC.1